MSGEAKTLAREEYTSLSSQGLGHAGIAASLEVETQATWPDTHWHIHAGPHGATVLSPRNAAPRGWAS